MNVNAAVKFLFVASIIAVAILAVRSTDALAVCTRYFCSASVGIFAVASTIGLASRLRA